MGFAYEGPAGPILEEVSFTIRAGEKVAVLGPVGSGKSTLAGLLLGTQGATSGRILLDGIDQRSIDPGDLRRNIGAQLQDTWLFSGSVKDNILAGAIRAPDAVLHQKARVAEVDRFVKTHPHGYDLQLGENGKGLSGGQRQCIALARALVGDPPILVLDEPTANMDVQTEEKVIANLRAETADRTLLLITHRTALLALVDRVIVIEKGRVAYDGPKERLVESLRARKGSAA